MSSRRWYRVAFLALLPILWDTLWVDAWLSRGYHAAGGLLLRFYVPVAMPSFLNLTLLDNRPIVVEPSLNTARYVPHAPHLHVVWRPFLPHLSIAEAAIAVVGWSFIQWIFATGLIRWVGQLALAPWLTRIRGLLVYIVINLTFMAISWIAGSVTTGITRIMVGAILVPILLVFLKYIMAFFKFTLITVPEPLSTQWHHSQIMRQSQTTSLTGWFTAAVAIGFLSAMIANLSATPAWTIAWLVVVDMVYAWLIVLLVNYYRSAQLGLSSVQTRKAP